MKVHCYLLFQFFFNATATTEIYTYCHTLSLHDALPISLRNAGAILLHSVPATIITSDWRGDARGAAPKRSMSYRGMLTWIISTAQQARPKRSEEHTSELQSLMRISYAVFCLKKKSNTDITIIEETLY